MTAGVARTVPEGCHLGFPLDDACRRLMQSKREHKARLYFGGARCGSACVYAIIGASTRHVDAGATLRIHSGLGPEVDKAENFLRRYVVSMGVDPAVLSENHIRTYWWCSPDKIGMATMTPDRWTQQRSKARVYR